MPHATSRIASTAACFARSAVACITLRTALFIMRRASSYTAAVRLRLVGLVERWSRLLADTSRRRPQSQKRRLLADMAALRRAGQRCRRIAGLAAVLPLVAAVL
jgi:hypothetical protein